jgi:hypothetical protein
MAKPCSWPCCLNARRVTSMFLRRQQAIRTQTEQSFMGARWTPVAIALCHSTAGTFGLSTVFVPSPQPPSQFQAMWTSSEPSRSPSSCGSACGVSEKVTVAGGLTENFHPITIFQTQAMMLVSQQALEQESKWAGGRLASSCFIFIFNFFNCRCPYQLVFLNYFF